MSALGNRPSRELSACSIPEQMTRVRNLFAATDDPYAGGDRATARRLGALVWRVSTILVLMLLPLAPPTAALGVAGWPIVAASTGVGLIAARRLADRSREVSWDALLAFSYVGVVQIAALQWLAGAPGASAYGELYLLITVYAGGVHPPRRVLGVLAAVALGASAPLAYGEFTSGALAMTITRVLLWSALAFLASALMRAVRAQRLGLKDRGERAEQLARVDELTGLP